MMNIHEYSWTPVKNGLFTWQYIVYKVEESSTPDASSSVSPSSPSSWGAQCKLGLEDWETHSFTVLMFSANCPFNQFFKNVETSDTPNHTTIGGQFAQEATKNWIVLVVGQSVHIIWHIRISSETSWPEYIDAFWIGLMGCNTLPSDQFCTGSVNFLAGYSIGVGPSNPYKHQKSS